MGTRTALKSPTEHKMTRDELEKVAKHAEEMGVPFGMVVTIHDVEQVLRLSPANHADRTTALALVLATELGKLVDDSQGREAVTRVLQLVRRSTECHWERSDRTNRF